MTFSPNAACTVCGIRVRAVIGYRQPNAAYVGIEPFLYACSLHDARRLHRHQGYATWLPDGKIHLSSSHFDMGWPVERYRLRPEALAARREAARDYVRRPPECHVTPPEPAAPAPRTAQRRLA